MVDWSKVSADLAGRIKEIINSEGDDPEKAVLNKPKEYTKLQELLSGMDKNDPQKGFIEGMLRDYEESDMVRPHIKEQVLNKIKNGDKMQAEETEKKELREFLKDNRKNLTSEERTWINEILNGRVVKEPPKKEAKTEETPTQNTPVENNDKKEDVGVTKAEEKPNEITKNVPNKVTEEVPEEKPQETSKEPKENHNADKQNPPMGKPLAPPVVVPVPVAPPRVVDNDRVDDKDGVDNKGATQQGGMGNINVQNGTVVINNGVPIAAYPIDGGNGVAVPVPDTPDVPVTKGEDSVGEKKSENEKISVEEVKEARDNGETVADALLGHTSNTEQRTVQDIVNEEVNSGNVLEFLRGYENGLAEDRKKAITNPAHLRPADHFFEQMRTENNFPEKQDLMRKVAEDLQGYLANKYGVDSDVAREVAIILLEQTFEKEQADALDKIYQKELEPQDRKKRPARGLGSAVGLGIDAIRNLTE